MSSNKVEGKVQRSQILPVILYNMRGISFISIFRSRATSYLSKPFYHLKSI